MTVVKQSQLSTLVAVCKLLKKLKISVLVFDLDLTIWNNDVSLFDPPFHKGCNKTKSSAQFLTDKRGNKLKMLEGSSEFFRDIDSMVTNGAIQVAVASHSPTRDKAMMALKEFNLLRFFRLPTIQVGDACQIGCKSVHIRRIKDEIGCNYDQMLFFDDLPHQISIARSMGVHALQVFRDGVKSSSLLDYLKKTASEKISPLDDGVSDGDVEYDEGIVNSPVVASVDVEIFSR